MKIAIVGYGNLGKAIEKISIEKDDIEIKAIFSRRFLYLSKSSFNIPILPFSEIVFYKNEIDVVFNCMGSATDLPVITPYLAEYFNVIDCFEGTEEEILLQSKKVNKYAQKGQTTAIVNCGYNSAFVDYINQYTKLFLSKNFEIKYEKRGLDTYFTNLVKNIDAVEDAFSIKTESGIVKKQIKTDNLSKEKCFLSVGKETNKQTVFEEMSAYAKKCDIHNKEINFKSKIDELKSNKYFCKKTDYYIYRNNGKNFSFKFSLSDLEDIYEMSALIMLKYAGVLLKMNKNKEFGCKTPLDIPLSYFINQN